MTTVTDLNLKSFDRIYPLLVQKYNTLVPDPNANILDKINSIVEYLNSVGKVSNDVVDNWNKVMAWTMNDGLTTDVNNKIESMNANGELNSILTSLFNAEIGDLTTLQTNDKSKIVNAINEVDNLAKSNQTNVGTLTNLTTTDKSTLVNAINENVGKINSNTSSLADIALDVKKFGAIGDDQSHPLSSKYSTLAAAQAVYPCATALTNEIDWCAIQTAINSLPDSHWYNADIPKGGGKVYIPEGNYHLNQSIVLRNSVALQGAGRFATRLIFDSSVNYGITTSNYTDNNEVGARGIEISNLAINNPQNGINLLSVARSNFYNIHISGCSQLGLISDLCVGNRYDFIYTYGCGTGIYVHGDNGAMNTTQWFTNIYTAHSVNNGITVSGGQLGVQGMSFFNIISEYNNIGIMFDGGTNPSNVFGNSFKHLWLEGNTQYAFYLNSGIQTTLENVFSDSTAIWVVSADKTTFKDIKADINIQNTAGLRYFEGYYAGTLTDSDTTKTYKLDNLYTQVNNLYKKYIGSSDAGLLQNAGNYIKGSTDGIYQVTITDSANNYYSGIFNFKNGSQNIVTNLAGTLTVATNTAGTVTPSGGTSPYTYTVDLLSSK